MSRKPTLGPDWLVGMLAQWGRRCLTAEGRALGYPRICPMLRDGIPNPNRSSHEPTGYSNQDFTDLELALRELQKNQALAVMRYAKPWKKATIDAENPKDTDTWLYHLKQGLAVLAVRLDKTTVHQRAVSD